MSNEEPFGPHEEPFEPHESLVGDVPELAPCPAREALMEQASFEWNRTRAFKACRICPLRRQPDLGKLASELESMAATLHEPPCECALCAQVHGIATYIRNWKGGGQ